MSSVHPQTFCENQGNYRAVNGNESKLLLFSIIKIHKTPNLSTDCAFSLMCQNISCFLQGFCVATQQYFLHITFVTSTRANLLNDVQLHHLCIITLFITALCFCCAAEKGVLIFLKQWLLEDRKLRQLLNIQFVLVD